MTNNGKNKAKVNMSNALGPKKLWDKKNWVQRIGLKDVNNENKRDKKKYLLKNILSKEISGQKIVRIQKNVGSKNSWLRKIWVKKTSPNTNFAWKIFWSQIQKMFGQQNN